MQLQDLDSTINYIKETLKNNSRLQRPMKAVTLAENGRFKFRSYRWQNLERLHTHLWWAYVQIPSSMWKFCVEMPTKDISIGTNDYMYHYNVGRLRHTSYKNLARYSLYIYIYIFSYDLFSEQNNWFLTLLPNGLCYYLSWSSCSFCTLIILSLLLLRKLFNQLALPLGQITAQGAEPFMKSKSDTIDSVWFCMMFEVKKTF